jgi:hypothetical protein
MASSSHYPLGQFAASNGSKQLSTRPGDIGDVAKLVTAVQALVIAEMEGTCTDNQAYSMVQSTASLGAGVRFAVAIPVFPPPAANALNQAYNLAQHADLKAKSDAAIKTLKACKKFLLEACDADVLTRCFPDDNALSMQPYAILDAILAGMRTATISEEANEELLAKLGVKILVSDELKKFAGSHAKVHTILANANRALNDGDKYQRLAKALSPESKLVDLLRTAKAQVPAAQADDFIAVTTEFIRQGDLQNRTEL